MNTRLRQFMAAENITQSQLADSLNVVRASVSHILSGRNNPSYDFIKALIQHYPRLNMEWLMFGKGKMYNTPQQSVSEPSAPVKPTEQEQDTTADEIDGLFPSDDIFHDSTPPATIPIPEPQPTQETKSEFSTAINTLGNLGKSIGGQRKVVKVTILFDDGTYQEL